MTGGNSVPVAIVGAGPVGLALALGLARHGVRSLLLERKPATSEHSKAPVIHVRTREVFHQWGVEQRFVDAGELLETLTLYTPVHDERALVSINFSALNKEADRPGLLVLEQSKTEALLLDAVRESGLCDVCFNTEVVGLAPAADGARLRIVKDGAERSLDAEFVVGCDGAGSLVRRALGLPFDGLTYPIRPMLADVRVDEAYDALAWPRVRDRHGGVTAAIRLRPGVWRIIRVERGESTRPDSVSEDEVRQRVDETMGVGRMQVLWASRFRTHLRSSPRFRVGRILLAGDAAHIHSPAGGLGLNAGVQDAHNLAWKLAYALSGGDAERLLDSYDVERRTVVVGNVSRYADFLTRAILFTPGPLRAAAFPLARWLLHVGRVRTPWLRQATMIDLGYPASPLLDEQENAAGVRLPNLLLRAPNGRDIRLYDLLPAAGPAILDVAEERSVRIDLPVEDIIRIGEGGYRDQTGSLQELIGAPDGWIMVRPDAHIAWARERPEGIGEATRRALGQRA